MKLKNVFDENKTEKNKMKIVILTTPTDHHTYFVNKIANEFEIEAVFFESEHVQFPFDTTAPFAEEESDYEKSNFFKSVPDTIDSNIPIHSVPTVNHSSFGSLIKKYNPDIGVVFGCGRIKPHVFENLTNGLINVHRGIAEQYRGLDSDLWAIYHGDYENIGVTIHFVDEDLDTGKIIFSKSMRFASKDTIFHIRYKTTVMAADMVIQALKNKQKSSLKVYPNNHEKSRYYSAMPAVLKPVCEKKYQQFIKKRFSRA